MLYLWTRLRVSFNAYMLILVAIRDLPGVNSATNDTDTLLLLNDQSGLV
jgi:hypothetical protein